MARERSGWIPYAFVAFFGVVLVANLALIWIAFTSWTGLEAESAYRRGLDYNRVLERAEAQAALGWDVDLALTQQDEHALAVGLALADRHGNPIEDASVNAAFLRPTHAGHDRSAVVPHRAGGTYQTGIELPLPGQWDVAVTIEAGGEVWRTSRRVYLRP